MRHTWRGPHHKKVTPEIKEAMSNLKKEGCSYKQIAEQFEVSATTVSYHLTPGTKEKNAVRSKKSMRKKRLNMSKEEKQERTRKNSEYIKARYRADPEFRRRFIDHVLRYNRKVRDSKKGAPNVSVM